MFEVISKFENAGKDYVGLICYLHSCKICDMIDVEY